MQNMKARLVGGEPGALDLHAANRPHRHGAIRFAIPRAAPMLQLDQFLGGLMDEILDRILVAEPVATTYGVMKVLFIAIVGLDHSRGTTLRSASMTAHRIN